MKQIFSVIIMSAMMACNGVKESKDTSSQAASFIGQPDVKIENGQMTPEVLWAFGRVGNLSVSPDGRRVAYTITYYSITENKSNADIFIVDADGHNRKQLTKTTAREGS
ncbi:MAG: peptidase S9, partial [Tannerella sp.]|nr:peptidase S9 [Tannerella sp.]